jgi:hypothetical protein
MKRIFTHMLIHTQGSHGTKHLVWGLVGALRLQRRSGVGVDARCQKTGSGAVRCQNASVQVQNFQFPRCLTSFYLLI